MGTVYFSRSTIPNAEYITYIMLVVLVASLANLISRFQRRVQLKRERMLENRLGLWNNISYKVKKRAKPLLTNCPSE